MKTQVQSISLDGANRRLDLAPGLNLITGPIASGKTTLVRYIRFLLGGSLGQPPPEARAVVTAVSGTVDLGGREYSIVRPAVSTSEAIVDIAGDRETWRLPASKSADGNTYKNWLLQQLDLPRLEVPTAPTKLESASTPVSISDYMLYSYLAQKDLGFSVFGHHDNYKNLKRKYVFEIAYGFYDLAAAQTRERLRQVLSDLRELESRQSLFERFFADTALSNRARIERDLASIERDLAEAERLSMELASVSHEDTETARLRNETLELERKEQQLQEAVDGHRTSLDNLHELTRQLESQSSKLTRAIVSHKHLMDLEFVVCPRCGADLDADRAHSNVCHLCLQTPSLEFSRKTLVEEQGAVEYQLTEVQDLIRARDHRLRDLHGQLTEMRDGLTAKRQELDFRRRSYVSEHARRIASVSARRADLGAQQTKMREYLVVLSRIDEEERIAAQLNMEKEALQQELEAATGKSDEGYRRVEHLTTKFNDILQLLKPPQFGEEDTSKIDMRSYLPDYYGRTFAELSSPGLATLVNLAHALAHHLTAIELGLKLPDLLIIDGLSEHLGQEGLDPERLMAAYDVLRTVSHEHPELQVILVDNEVPESARGFVRLELSEDDRLIRNTEA